MSSLSAFGTTAATSSNGIERPTPTRFALIGAGWRSRVFIDLARAYPALFELTAVLSRRPEKLAGFVPPGTAVVSSIAEVIATRPEFVVVAVPWPATPEVTRELVATGTPVIAETPPAPDLEGLRALWRDIGGTDLVHVAEQYLRMPDNAAAAAIVRSGAIGRATYAHVSSTHEYHAISMLRGFLGVGLEPVTVTARTTPTLVLDPIDPNGWHPATEPSKVAFTLATIDFGDDRLGLYDFTDNQWWNPLRPDHLTIRGERGEYVDGQVVRYAGHATPLVSHVVRGFTGRGMNLEGADATTVSWEGDVLYRNRFEGARFSDDELAVADLVADAGRWARGETPGPYALADACHDHAIALAIRHAAATGATQTVTDEPWMTTTH